MIDIHFNSKSLSKDLISWYTKNKRPLPWRLLFEKHKDPYHVWISEIMLQQTQIATVLPVYLRFIESFPDVYSLAEAEEEAVRTAVRGLGYYRRFASMHKAAKIISESGYWPNSFELWQDLPGIGPYTASALSSIVDLEPQAVVDGNVERIFARLFDLREDVTQPKFKKLFKQIGDHIICSANPGDFNQGIMQLGQLVCTPTTPDCKNCPLVKCCRSFKNESQKLAPGPKKKTPPIEVSLRLVIPKRNGKIGVFARPKEARFLKGIQGFLTFFDHSESKSLHDGISSLKIKRGTSYGKIKHSITKHKILASVEVVDLPKNAKISESLTFLSIEEVEEKLTSNLDRKAFAAFQKNQPRLF